MRPKLHHNHAPGETIYMDEPVEFGEQVVDFLPSPEELAKAARNVKITITLSRHTLDFFQHLAKQQGLSERQMIRRLLEEYVQQQNGKVERLQGYAVNYT